MARLGAVLGGLLAEITRARVVSDTLTRELLDEYENDPILSSIGVPRVTIGGAEIVVRYAVDNFEEKEPNAATAAETRDAWLRHAEKTVIPGALRSRGLSDEDASAVVAKVTEEARSPVGRPRVTEIRNAIGGNTTDAALSSSKPLLDNWATIPRTTRESLGTKAAFRKYLTSTLESELKTFLDRKLSSDQLQAALASKLDVSVGRGELAKEDPSMIQEVRLTITSDDLDLVLQADADGGVQ